MSKELNLEQGVQETIRLVEHVPTNLILCTVYGIANNGKTHFLDLVIKELEKLG